MAVFSLPYGSQRHKALGGIPSSSAKPPSPSARQRQSSSKHRWAFKQLTAASAFKHHSVWEYFAPLNPWRSPTLLLTVVKRENWQDELMAIFSFLFTYSCTLSVFVCLMRCLLLNCLSCILPLFYPWRWLVSFSCTSKIMYATVHLSCVQFCAFSHNFQKWYIY